MPFPSNPQVGDTYGKWVWDGDKWVCAPHQSSHVVVDDSPPEDPGTGLMWFNTDDGKLYIWTGNEWVAANCCEDLFVVTDSTLIGDGTSSSPLGAVRFPVIVPTFWSRYTVGSGTYTPPAGVSYIRVKMTGGGGGGGGAGNGGTGGQSSFGSWQARGGNGGIGAGNGGTAWQNGGAGGSGGSGGANGTGNLITRVSGWGGLWGGSVAIGDWLQSGAGATYSYGNTAAGVGGWGAVAVSTSVGGGGAGGAGEYVEFVVPNPVSTAYVIGAGGTAPSAAGGSGLPGGGAPGSILVEEYY